MAEGGSDTRPVFGSRFLKDPDKVFEHNAWDNVEWGEDQERDAEVKVQLNSSQVLPEDARDQYEEDAAKHWDAFYQIHQNRFFKDRHWLFTEFPELKGASTSGKFTILEVGCGVGNTVFPILQVNSNPDLFIYCCDFAESAVRIVKEHTLYDPRHVHAFQYDLTSPEALPIPPASLDLVVMVFVLSAIQPCYHEGVVKKLCAVLKPRGKLLFRDYGRYDLAQLRFKKGQCLSEQFYVRGDGTRVYFFTSDEVKALLERGGVQEEQLLVDRRLQVNRGKQVKMYRVWIQAKFVRPPAGEVAPPPVPDQHPTNSGAQNYPFTHSLTSDSVDSSVTISVSTCSEHCAPETSSTP